MPSVTLARRERRNATATVAERHRIALRPDLSHAGGLLGAGQTSNTETRPVVFEFVRDFNDFPLTPAAWDAFVEANGGDVFCSYAWCSAWWRHFGRNRKLLLGLARRGNELVAIMPLFSDTIRLGPFALSVIRLVGSDYGVTPSAYVVLKNAQSAVAAAFARALQQMSDWDVVCLAELPAYQVCVDPLASSLRDCFGEEQVSFRGSYYPQMVFAVPTTYEEYVASLGARERGNLVRDLRQVESGAACRRLDGDRSGDAQRALGTLFALHERQWRVHGRLGHAGDWPGWKEFVFDVATESASRGDLLLTSARVKDDTVATELTLRFGRRAHWLIGGRMPSTSSRVGFAGVMRAAIDARVSVLDGLGGDFAYKRRLGADHVWLKAMTVCRPCEQSTARVAAMRNVVRMVDASYFRAWTWRAAPALRRRWPWIGKHFGGRGYWKTFMQARFLRDVRSDAPAREGASQ